MNKLFHLWVCQHLTDDEDTKNRMFNSYLCGEDPFIATGEGIPNLEKKNPFSLLNGDDQFDDDDDDGFDFLDLF